MLREPGQIYFLSGKGTKVEIIGDADSTHVFCKILAIGKNSRFQVGKIYPIYYRILYPNQRIPAEKKKPSTMMSRRFDKFLCDLHTLEENCSPEELQYLRGILEQSLSDISKKFV